MQIKNIILPKSSKRTNVWKEKRRKCANFLKWGYEVIKYNKQKGNWSNWMEMPPFAL